MKFIEIYRNLQDLNAIFLSNDKNGVKIDNQSYIFKHGKIPILISVPHAVKQCRNGQTKLGDYLTGPLAILISGICDCYYFVRTYNEEDDPNFPVGYTLEAINNDYLKN